MTTAGERLAQLKAQHGSLAEVVKAETEFTYIAYDNVGDIHAKSNKDLTQDSKYANLMVYKFNTKDIKILEEKGKSVAQFSIEKDEHDVCHIKLKTFETDTVKSEKEFLSQISKGNAKSYDVKVSLNKKSFTVTLHSNVIGKPHKTGLMAFHVTEKNDPHFIIETFTINLAELYKEKQIEKFHTIDNIDVSIYTTKIYDKYVRT
tara:strand:- start:454 stop:1065 length:612 start_codon:yes stop_codon:yes gene_type:complete